MTGKRHCHMIRCVEFQSLLQCRRKYLPSDAEKVGLLAPYDEKLSGIETEIEAADKFGLSGKGKAISDFLAFVFCVHSKVGTGM